MNRCKTFWWIVYLFFMGVLVTKATAVKIWACGDLEKIHPKSGKLMHRSWSSFSKDEAYKKYNFHWNESTNTVMLEGAKGEVLGFQVIVDRQKEDLSNVHFTLDDLEGPDDFPVAGNSRIFRTFYLDNSYSGVLVPLDKAFTWDYFSIPDKGNLGFLNNNQAIWIDLFIPTETAAGTYRGSIIVEADQLKESKTLNLCLTVWDITLPEDLNYDVELNNYGSLYNNFDWAVEYRGFDQDFDREVFLEKITEEQRNQYIIFERNAYKLCHNNRVSFNTVPYWQSGTASTIVPESMIPELAGEGESLCVTDWKAFDERWGPLFDGSAFIGCYRKGVPLAHHYLPFCHNFPSSFENFITDQTDPPYWGKNPIYEEENIAFAREFEQHANEKEWNRTIFQVFYNEKQNKKKNRIIWHMDEPIDTTIGMEYKNRKWITYSYTGKTKKILRGSFDYEAHRYYSRLMHTGFNNTMRLINTLGDPETNVFFKNPEAAKFVYRLDIGRQNLIQVQQGVLDGYIDHWMVGGSYVLNSIWKRVDKGEIYTTYKYSGATPKTSNCYYTLTAWDDFRKHSTGHEVWQTIHDWENLLESWTSGTSNNTLLYPGSTIRIDEPCACYRIKSMRRGAQDYEYLLLLKELSPGKEMEILTSFLESSDTEPESEFRSRKLSPEIFYEKKRELALAILEVSGKMTRDRE